MLKTRTEHYYEDAEHGEFPLPFGGAFSNETLQVSADGLTARLGMLCQDDSPEDPLEAYDEGEFYQFDRSRVHDCDRPGLEDWKRIIRGNPGRVVPVDSCGYRFSAQNRIMTPADCRGKKGSKGEDCPAASVLDDMDGYYIAPEDVTDPAKYAAGTIQSYSDWCEGEVYGVCVWTYARPDTESPWELQDRDECWGYIGAEYAEEELNSYFKEETK